MEEWKDIKGYEGKYQVSNIGNVKSLNYNHTHKEKILKLGKADSFFKYCTVDLFKDGKHNRHFVHRLVAQEFIPNPNNLPQVNHKDGNKLNNKVTNLEWITQSENVKHAYETNLIKHKRKAVNQYDLNGRFIKKWNGVREIQRILGYSSGALCDCCKGRQKTAYGYKWEYAI